MTTIYIPFYSRTGAVEVMAGAVAEGVISQGAEPRLAFTGNLLENAPQIARDRDWRLTDERLCHDYPLANAEDLANADGAIFGTPALFGSMAAEMKVFIDKTYDVWRSGRLQNKPAGTFTASKTLHGGQETASYTMWAALAHLGFLIVGVPYTAGELHVTYSGGTPYGPSHVGWLLAPRVPDQLELRVCRLLGARVAALAQLTRPLHGAQACCEPGQEQQTAPAHVPVRWRVSHAVPD